MSRRKPGGGNYRKNEDENQFHPFTLTALEANP